MIFDTDHASDFVGRYCNRPIWELPKAYFLATADHLSGEREYLERLFALAPKAVRPSWLGGFFSRRESQHVATWFELMLYGWLLEIGMARPIPPTDEETPDFRARIENHSFYVEAVAHLVPHHARQAERRASQLYFLLQEIQRPFLVEIHNINLSRLLKPNHFKAAVTGWLDSNPEEIFHYQDNPGNSILMNAKPSPISADHVVFVSSSAVTFVDHQPVMRPLRRKADKYQKVRYRSPFIIAIYLEAPLLSASEVVNALFGRTQVLINPEKFEIIDVKVDRSGILFYKDTILHTSVSGILVFRSRHSDMYSRRFLDASYIENPYANNPVDPKLFSTIRSFICTGKSSSAYTMTWLPDEPD